MGKDAWDSIASPETLEQGVGIAATAATYEAFTVLKGKVAKFVYEGGASTVRGWKIGDPIEAVP